MIDLITTSLRFTVLILSGFYSFSKLSQAKLKPVDLLFIPAAAAVSVALYYLSPYVGMTLPFFIFIVIFLFSLRFKKQFYATASITIISYGIAILVLLISALSASIALIPAYLFLSESVRYTLQQVVMSVFHLIFTIILFKIKRLNSRLLRSTRNNTIYERMSFMGSVIIFGFALTYFHTTRNLLLELIIVFIAFYCLTFIILWRGHISQRYRNEISQRNIQILEAQLSEMEEENAKLFEQNVNLAQIIHSDNKLLPAMKIAVKNVCENTDDEQASILLENIQTLYEERAVAVENLESENYALPRTNVVSIDAVMRYLYGKAQNCGAEFQLEVNDGAVETLAKTLKENIDLITIICDLGENAVIAVKKVEGAKIKIVFGKTGEYPCVNILDNGAPFEENVIARMGLNKITTHKDEGGSGIGLVNTFELLRKNNASLIINELNNEEGYTKCVSVLFDGKYAHKVYSSRESVKKLCSSRTDLQVLEK